MKKVSKNLLEDKARAIQNYPQYKNTQKTTLCKSEYTFYSCLISLIMPFLSPHNRWDAAL